MGSIWVREFKGGLDLRRLPETSPGGVLIRAFDCHINKGGEIEQRAVFEHFHTLDPNTAVGLGAVRGRGVYVFGHDQDIGVLPSPLVYQMCGAPLGVVPLGMVHFEDYGNRPACILRYPGDLRYAFADGQVTDDHAPPRVEDSGNPESLLTFKQKLQVSAGPVVYFSALKAPTTFDDESTDPPGTGAGFIDFSFEVGAANDVFAQAVYDESVAFFSEDSILIWSLAADLDTAAQRQRLEGVGTRESMSPQGFAGGDILFLHTSGIRSLRARDSSRYATTTDIGTPIDDAVVEQYRALSPLQRRLACSVIEPRTGNIWLALGDRIFVLSYHQANKIAAWTIYRPGFVVDHMTVYDGRVYLRSGLDVYVYGGAGAALDPYSYSADVVAEAWLAYLDADRPTQVKHVNGVDTAVRGTWAIRLSYDPENLHASDHIATVTNTSYMGDRIPVSGASTHIGVRLSSQSPAGPTLPARVSSFAIHHDLDDEEA